MKRLQISLEHELDDELGRAAAGEGISKAEVVRRLLRERFAAPGDPLVAMFGSLEGGEPGDSADHDELIYGG